jgi:hypothetical protein
VARDRRHAKRSGWRHPLKVNRNRKRWRRRSHVVALRCRHYLLSLREREADQEIREAA